MKIKKRRKIIISSFLLGLLLSAALGVKFVRGQINDKQNAEINQLNAQIQSQKQQLDNLKAKQDSYAKSIAAKQAQGATLKNQLSLLDDKIAQAQVQIEANDLEISKTSLEAQKINLDIIDVNSQLEAQKDHIASLLRLIYKHDQVSSLEVLLLNNSISEFLNQAKYLQNANDELRQSLASLENNKDRLEKNQEEIKTKNEELAKLKKDLENQKAKLQYQESEKNYLLNETKSSERAYQNLLAEAKRQASQAAAEIASLEKTVREKMSQSTKNKLSESDSTLTWPISGRHIITTTFHDPTYPFRKIIGEHPAIDLAKPQGSPLYAAADGYVARSTFNGSSKYAYIMIIHNNGLSTVYGHVSASYVKADEYVTKGQLIGKTGGGPGMPGSGPFTTGPHLHFEVRLNGIPVNPLDYLPSGNTEIVS